MRIGFVENILCNRYIIFWFYKHVNGVWVKIHEERVPIGFRDVTLERIARNGAVVKLGGVDVR